jgi:hypothetical protein
MYSHGVFEAEKTPLKTLDPLAWRVEREKDKVRDHEKRDILFRRPRHRLNQHT